MKHGLTDQSVKTKHDLLCYQRPKFVLQWRSFEMFNNSCHVYFPLIKATRIKTKTMLNIDFLSVV
jgi:hypothetical protein